jgi:hypothetical protein
MVSCQAKEISFKRERTNNIKCIREDVLKGDH